MSLRNKGTRVSNPFDRFEQSLPQLPQEIIDQYPELANWQDAMQTWFDTLRQTIEANQEVLLAKVQELE